MVDICVREMNEKLFKVVNEGNLVQRWVYFDVWNSYLMMLKYGMINEV